MKQLTLTTCGTTLFLLITAEVGHSTASLRSRDCIVTSALLSLCIAEFRHFDSLSRPTVLQWNETLSLQLMVL